MTPADKTSEGIRTPGKVRLDRGDLSGPPYSRSVTRNTEANYGVAVGYLEWDGAHLVDGWGFLAFRNPIKRVPSNTAISAPTSPFGVSNQSHVGRGRDGLTTRLETRCHRPSGSG